MLVSLEVVPGWYVGVVPGWYVWFRLAGSVSGVYAAALDVHKHNCVRGLTPPLQRISEAEMREVRRETREGRQS